MLSLILIKGDFKGGAADEARTRDPLRDRQVF